MAEHTGDFVPGTHILPDGKQEIRMELSPKARQENLATAVRSYDGRTVGRLGEGGAGAPSGRGSFPEFVHAMSMIGEFDQIDTKAVAAIDARGQRHTMTDPTDAVLIGEANSTETLDFIFRRLTDVKVGSSHVGLNDPTAPLLQLWEDYKPYLVEIEGERNAARRQVYEEHKQKVFKRGGATDALVAFSRGEDPEYNAYLDEIATKDAQVLPKVKAVLKDLDQGKPLPQASK